MNAIVLLLDDGELDTVAAAAQTRGVCIGEMLRELLRLPPRLPPLDRPALALVPNELADAPGSPPAHDGRLTLELADELPSQQRDTL